MELKEAKRPFYALRNVIEDFKASNRETRILVEGPFQRRHCPPPKQNPTTNELSAGKEEFSYQTSHKVK
jgi:hypothetical protein